jgi:hypothetical protein
VIVFYQEEELKMLHVKKENVNFKGIGGVCTRKRYNGGGCSSNEQVFSFFSTNNSSATETSVKEECVLD